MRCSQQPATQSPPCMIMVLCIAPAFNLCEIPLAGLGPAKVCQFAWNSPKRQCYRDILL